MWIVSSNGKKARTLFKALGTPSLNEFKTTIKINVIQYLPVTLYDIKNAEAH